MISTRNRRHEKKNGGMLGWKGAQGQPRFVWVGHSDVFLIQTW